MINLLDLLFKQCDWCSGSKWLLCEPTYFIHMLKNMRSLNPVTNTSGHLWHNLHNCFYYSVSLPIAVIYDYYFCVFFFSHFGNKCFIRFSIFRSLSWLLLESTVWWKGCSYLIRSGRMSTASSNRYSAKRHHYYLIVTLTRSSSVVSMVLQRFALMDVERSSVAFSS